MLKSRALTIRPQHHHVSYPSLPSFFLFFLSMTTLCLYFSLCPFRGRLWQKLNVNGGKILCWKESMLHFTLCGHHFIPLSHPTHPPTHPLTPTLSLSHSPTQTLSLKHPLSLSHKLLLSYTHSILTLSLFLSHSLKLILTLSLFLHREEGNCKVWFFWSLLFLGTKMLKMIHIRAH